MSKFLTYIVTSPKMGCKFLIIIILLQVNGCESNYCRLNDDDLAYLYADGSKIRFLENGTDTIEITAEIRYGEKDEGTRLGFPDFKKEEIGVSILKFDSLQLSISKKACWDLTLLFRLKCYNCDEIGIKAEWVPIGDPKTDSITVLNTSYTNYYEIGPDSIRTTDFKVMYYNKDKKLLKLELNDGYLLELLPD